VDQNLAIPSRIPVKHGKPPIRLPNNGHLISTFAGELGGLVAGHGIFVRQGIPFTLDFEGQKFETATPMWLRTWSEQHVTPYFARNNHQGEIYLNSTMSYDTACAVLKSPQFLEKLPMVERFNPCPMPSLRPDGKIDLLPIGLDSESRTYTADPGFTIEPKTIEESRAVLDNLFNEFAWPDDGGRSKAVATSAMLTVFASGIMPQGSTKPVFIYVANAEGSGKTTLAQFAGIPYPRTPIETAPGNESEWDKKLLTVVISGRRLLLMDNVKGHLNSGALEGYSTSPYYRGRILGESKEFQGEAGATILITGNKLTVSPDLRRRSLFIELFSDELRAEDRKYRRILDSATIVAMRPEILRALWGMVKAWDEGGRPPASHHNASFPRWCNTIAGIVEYAGYHCPTSPAVIEDIGDTDTTDITDLAGVMQPDVHYTFEALSKLAIEKGLFERITSDTENNELSRSAKTAFSRILARYDRRRVSESMYFIAAGKGHQRRYLLKADSKTHT